MLVINAMHEGKGTKTESELKPKSSDLEIINFIKYQYCNHLSGAIFT
jgi:hypothetical protein